MIKLYYPTLRETLMGIIRWKPWHEIDRFFDNLPSLSGISFDLAADVYEDKNSVVVKMHVPGVDADKIHIRVENTHLHVMGEREDKEEVKDEHCYHREIRYGSFERVIQLPCRVAQKDVRADLKDGILVITLPKEEKKEAHRVMVTK